MLFNKLNKTPVFQLAALFLVMSFALFMGACSDGDELGGSATGGENSNTPNVTPTANDYNYAGIGEVTYDGTAKPVTITPKGGKSTGTRKIYYEGTNDTNYTKRTAAPSAIGTYDVTFDVAATTGFNAATGLIAGTLNISSSGSAGGGDPSSDASLASLTINGVAVTWPTNASANPNSNVTYWYDATYYATVSMTQTQFAGGNPLNIVATPNDTGARIRGYAINTTSSNLYTGTGGADATDWEIKEENWVLTSEESFVATNFVNKSTRIFVWVEAEDGTWGFYRVNEITVTADPGDPGTPVPSSDASLASITINGIQAVTIPASATSIPTGAGPFITIAMTTDQFAGGNPLTIVATPTDSNAKVVGYAVAGSSSNLTTAGGGWDIYSIDGITVGHSATNFVNDTTRIFVWVKAEDGTNGYYRINTITVN